MPHYHLARPLSKLKHSVLLVMYNWLNAFYCDMNGNIAQCALLLSPRPSISQEKWYINTDLFFHCIYTVLRLVVSVQCKYSAKTGQYVYTIFPVNTSVIIIKKLKSSKICLIGFISCEWFLIVRGWTHTRMHAHVHINTHTHNTHTHTHTYTYNDFPGRSNFKKPPHLVYLHEKGS